MDLVESYERCIVLWVYRCTMSGVYWTSILGHNFILIGDMMNERIKELARQAEFSENDLHTQGDNFQYFAELIVRECIGCCEQVISDPVPESVDTWSNGGEQCIQEIKQHFGVEE